MDTIRTLYVSAYQAVKNENDTYDLNIVGGISVADGARVYVDNIAMTNNVCEEITEADKWVYLKTFEQVDVPDVRNRTINFHGTEALPETSCTLPPCAISRHSW